MSDNVVILHSVPIDLNSDMGHQFVIDCVRAGEGLLTDSELQQKYALDPKDWMDICKDAALGKMIRAEAERRVFNGVALRESAAKHAIKGPTILATILGDESANARHRIDAFQTLRQTAIGNGDDHPAKPEQFLIRIDLSAGGGTVEEYRKTIDASAKEVTDDNG